MKKQLAAIVLAAVLAASAAQAHGPSGPKVAGANGGDIADVDGGHLELVVSAGELTVFVTDLQDRPMATSGLSGRAILQDGGTQSIVLLAPAEPNILRAALAKALPANAKIAISVMLAKDAKPVLARFVVK